MANFNDLLGSFLQKGMARSGGDRVGHALQDLQGGLGSAAGGRPPSGGGALDNLLSMAKGTLSSASQNPLQAGGIGAVVGSLLGGGGDAVKGALTGGALAMLAGVAFKALSGAGQGGGVAPGATKPQFSGGEVPLGVKAPESPAEHQAVEHTAQLVIRGMINIAKADGQVGVDEVQRIVGRLREAGIDAESQDWLMHELRQPLDLDAFVAEIPSQEVAAEVYAASLLAVEVDTPEEQRYLSEFARKTGLHPVVVQHIHETLGVAI